MNSRVRYTVSWPSAAFAVALAGLLAPPQVIAALLMGDMNGDGVVNWRDIDPFVAAMNDAIAGHAGPIDYWPLDGLARDYGSRGNHGLLVGGAAFSPEVPPEVGIGQALVLGGDGDYMDLGTGLLEGGCFAHVTFEAWFKAGAQADPHATIFANETSDGEFSLFVWNEGVAEPLLMATAYVAGQPYTLWGPVVTDDQWHHVAVRKNATHVALFLDGGLRDSVAAMGPLHVNGLWHATIGCKYTDTPHGFFEGLIDEVRIYDRALSDVEIATAAGVVAHWEFDECAGEIAHDSSAWHRDGMLLGPPAWVTDPCQPAGCELSFDGNSYVYAGRSLLGGKRFEEFTFEAEFETDGQFDPQWIHGTIFKDETTDGEFNVGVRRDTGVLFVTIYTGDEGGLTLESATSVADSQRHHVALRKDATTITLYLDGAPVDTVSATGPLRVNGIWHVAIGSGLTSYPPTQYFKGVIDDVAIYSYSRSAGQIAYDAQQALCATR